MTSSDAREGAMQKARSPQYPAVGLKEAIEKAEAVYRQDYQHAIPRQLVAQHMGYQGLNGKSLGVLSALSKFGLLEGRGDDTRVSDLAVVIIAHPPGSPERVRALTEASAKPELFKELDARFPGKASDQALRAYMLTQKFIPSAADAAIRSYRETKALVESESGAYDSLQAMGAPEGHSMHQPQPPQTFRETPTADALPTPPPKQATDPYYFAFKPSVGFEGGFRLNSKADFEALIRMLQGFKTLYEELPPMRPNEPSDDDDDTGFAAGS
jgi:hypothetical protein